MNYFQNYQVSVQIIVLGQGKTLHNFHVMWNFSLSKVFLSIRITGRNSLYLDIRNSVSLPTFKAKLRSTLFSHSYYKSSISHTRFRLGFSYLREYLFKINRCASLFRECGLDSELVKHFFLFCPRYAAQRNVLLTLFSGEK